MQGLQNKRAVARHAGPPEQKGSADCVGPTVPVCQCANVPVCQCGANCASVPECSVPWWGQLCQCASTKYILVVSCPWGSSQKAVPVIV
eukprot:1158439-Pelagomonas_calceolata.AAC.8